MGMHSNTSYKSLFPIFETYPDMVYLDTGATSQKPKVVIEAEIEYYTKYNANILRSDYPLAKKSTELVETSRDKIAKFINASSSKEIIFTRGSTDSFNLLSKILLDSRDFKFEYQKKDKNINFEGLKSGDNIVVSKMEHHANFLPWMEISKDLDIEFRIVNYTEDCLLDYQDLATKVDEKTKIVALGHSSNVFGGLLDTQKVNEIMYNSRALFVLDAAQSVPHKPLDVQSLGADFVIFSAHKMYGPTGLGILYGRQSLLQNLSYWQVGGEMMEEVTLTSFTVAPLPYKYEAGTLPLAQIHALGKACDFLETYKSQDFYTFAEQEAGLINFAKQNLSPQWQIFSAQNSSIISLAHPKHSIYDLGLYLGNKNICVRTGKHCAHPLVDSLVDSGLLRVSLGMYNDKQDLERFLESLERFLKLES
jgi:SufS family cysteine desulfurase